MKLWIARDKAGSLFLYDQKPILIGTWFYTKKGTESFAINEKYFPEVTFENSPKKVELKIVD